MSDLAIKVENLSKQYKITRARYRHDTLRDQLVHSLKSAFRRDGKPDAETETFWALKDVSFEIKQGEVVGIIGRNGAGKSTLLKILSRIADPTKGRAEIYGRVASLLEVGVGFDRELTGRENVYLNGAILGMRKSEIARKFDEIVSFAEVEKFIDTSVKHYSSGMYVRLGFAVAAHLEPENLIVDEVLSVGDVGFQKKCFEKMADVAKEGRTVLLVSHQMSSVRSLCSTALWLKGGQLVESGPSLPTTEKYLGEILVPRLDQFFDNGTCVIHSAEVLDSHGHFTAALDTGLPWAVRVKYELREPIPTGVSLRVTNGLGIVVFDVHECIGTAELREPGVYATTFSFSSLSLSPGAFYLSVYLMVHRGQQFLVADPFCRFDVVGSLVGYGGTRLPFDIGGVVFVRPEVTTVRHS